MIHQKRLGTIMMERLRRKGTYKRPAETRGNFNDKGSNIKKRDKNVYQREELGHCKADTVEYGRYCYNRNSRSCFVILAEKGPSYISQSKFQIKPQRWLRLPLSTH